MKYRFEEDPGVARQLWSEEFDQDLDDFQKEMLAKSLSLSLFELPTPNEPRLDEEEAVLGGRILRTTGDMRDVTYLELRRRRDTGAQDWLPGVELRLVTTIDDDWQHTKLHQEVVEAFANLPKNT
jgi:hypothetical protein